MNTDPTIETAAQKMATNCTVVGVEGMIRNAKSQLVGLDEMDIRYRDVGGEARAKGRISWQQRLQVAERAMTIKKVS